MITATARQIGAIHAIAARVGLDDDTRRDLIERETGKRSACDLTSIEAGRVIDCLKDLAPARTTAKGAFRLDGPYAGKLRALWIRSIKGMKNDMRQVAPTRPLAGYVGGKKLLARRVIAAIEAEPHEVYCEAFVGMGGVFFRRRRTPKVEAINDLNRDVATFFRILQRHYQQFMDMLKWQVTSRAEFDRLVGVDPDRLTDLERAARFLYLQRLAFGGKVAGRNFGIDTNGPARFDITKLGTLLEAAHERLAGVWVECLPWRDFIARWDRKRTLFFLDPPYWGSEHYYGRGMFSRDDFEALAAALKGLQGRFVMTVNDVPELRRLFAWARVQPLAVSYTLSGNGKAAKARELLIRSP